MYVDEVAIERRMNGDKNVNLTPWERAVLVRRWAESDRSNNDCERVTGINFHREIKKKVA